VNTLRSNHAAQLAALTAELAAMKAQLEASPAAPSPAPATPQATRVKAHAVEKYSGDPGPPSALQWCRAARIVISSQGSPDEIEMLHTAGAALTGAALTWYTHLFETHEGPPFTTWKEFETALTARFQGQQPMEVAYEDLYRLRQIPGETVRAFDARLVNVYQDLEYAGGERSERTKLQDFQEKLLPEYRQELARMVALQRGSDPTYQLTKPAALAFLHTFMVSPPVPPQRLGYTSAPDYAALNVVHTAHAPPPPRRPGHHRYSRQRRPAPPQLHRPLGEGHPCYTCGEQWHRGHRCRPTQRPNGQRAQY